MPERTNIKVKGKQQSALNRLVEESKGTAKTSRKRTSNLTINLERVIKAINEQFYDEDTKKDLIKMAKRCPQGGLLSFMSSLSIHVTAIQRAKRGTDLVEKPVVVSQRRQQGLQDLERKVEKSKVAEALFYDNEEQVKATEIQRLQPQQSPQLPSV